LSRNALLARIWPSRSTSEDAGIPVDDKTAWHDPTVAAAYQRAALASDPTSDTRTPHTAVQRAPFAADTLFRQHGDRAAASPTRDDRIIDTPGTRL
jgi:hypothetical protein